MNIEMSKATYFLRLGEKKGPENNFANYYIFDGLILIQRREKLKADNWKPKTFDSITAHRKTGRYINENAISSINPVNKYFESGEIS